MHPVSGGVHLTVGVLGLPHRVSTHGIQQLVHGGALGEKVQNTKGGNPEAEFPPQICGPGLPPKIRVSRGAAQVNVNYLGDGVEGCCRGHCILHCKGPRLVGCLLHVVAGDRHGLGTAPRCRQQHRGGTARRQAGRESAGTWSKKVLKKAVQEGNSGKWGKFVRNWYQFRTNSYQIHRLVNL